MSSPAQSAGPLPLRLCIGWGLGTFGTSVMFNSVTILMQRYATDFLGIAALTWGYIYLGSKIYDAITDPLMGAISDRTHTAIGRRRPYLVAGTVLCTAAFYLLFHSLSVDENPDAAWLLLACMLLYSTGYTVFNVPYLSMLTEMTDDYKERARLVSFRVYAVGFGTIVGFALGPWLIGAMGGDREAHQLVAVIFSLVTLTALLACFLMTKDASQTDARSDLRLSAQQSVRLILDNRPFLRIIGLKITQLASVAVNQTLLVYFVIYVLGKEYQFLGVYGLVSATSIMLGPMICMRLLHRYDKRSMYLAAALVHAVGMLTWLLSGPSEPESMIMLRGAVLGMTAGAMIMMGQAMLPDAISYESLKTGLHREGVYTGIYITAEKVAFAAGGSLTAFIIGAAGYVSSTAGTVEQPQSAITAIYFCAAVLPAILAAISCLFLIGYDLSEKKLDQLRAQSIAT